MIELEEKKRSRVRGPTPRQRRIIAQLKATPDTRVAGEALGLSRAAIYMSNTRVYQSFSSLLDAMIDNYPVFKRRAGHDPTLYSRLRRLARMTKEGE